MILSRTDPELFTIAQKAIQDGDIETASYIHNRLRDLGNAYYVSLLNSDVEKHFKIKPIPFLGEAQTIAKSYSKNSTGTYTVYVVLLVHKYKKEIGLYVGQSSRTAEDRFKQHMAGGRLSARCHRHMRCLLPSIYSHMTEVSRDESLYFEDALIKRFKQAGIWTEGA